MTSTDVSAIEDRVAPALTSAAGFVRAPFSAATARALAQLAVGWVWAISAGLTLWICVVVSAGLVPALGIGLPLLAASLAGARLYGAAERARLELQLPVRLAEPSPLLARRPGTPGAWWSAMWAACRDGRGWAATVYAFLSMFLTSVFVALVTAAAGGAVAAVALLFVGRDSVVVDWLGAPFPLTVAVAVALGVALLWTAALLAQYGALLQVQLAQQLLGPSVADAAQARAVRAEQEAQVAVAEASTARERAVVLTETRAGAVAAADGERRRIERDLHDGAQQRLVALGVELGVAKRLAAQDPEAAAAALDHAHAEVKETLAELRNLVRGIHPAVLSDRGLDAALSALAARSTVPVRVQVDGDLAAATPAAQAAAYFVVAEALTNVAKHAQASSALVTAGLFSDGDDGCRLRVSIADDGQGGATAAPGSGLAGLRGRVAALDGTFDLDSPAGAGTRLTVEVPCAS
ncbi:sensor histidine kinase [Xylanimonas protaetiae]|uniref:histidine kinase n=1 Tax=Xylanimonas protaetiae TaxID=2509457 RepID=A0A4P6F2J5_9MICO|nr:histidine kinase [Xylanimonas protaetiae]QAY69724.1 sensor histidine kinase [Xylanimonas protaetiae]